METVPRRKGGKLLLHLINCSGMQVATGYATVDLAPAAGPLRIGLRTPQRPARVTLEPEGRQIVGTWKEGLWTGVLDRLETHAILAFTA